MIILCKDCSHNSVCKHKYDYMKTVEKIKTAVDSPFNLQLNCPFYSKEKSNYYNSGITLLNTVDDITLSNKNDTMLNDKSNNNDITGNETIQSFVDTNTKKLDELIKFNNCDGIGVIDCNDTGFYKE